MGLALVSQIALTGGLSIEEIQKQVASFGHMQILKVLKYKVVLGMKKYRNVPLFVARGRCKIFKKA